MKEVKPAAKKEEPIAAEAKKEEEKKEDVKKEEVKEEAKKEEKQVEEKKVEKVLQCLATVPNPFLQSCTRRCFVLAIIHPNVQYSVPCPLMVPWWTQLWTSV